MNGTRSAGALFVACGLSLGACQRPAVVSLEAGKVGVAEVERGRFDGGRELLDGFELAPGPASWGIGDSVLLGIAMDAPGMSRTWYMRATALGVPVLNLDGQVFTRSDSVHVRMNMPEGKERPVRVDFQLVPVVVELFDAEGQRLSETEALMPEICLRYGLVDSIDLEREGKQPYEGLDTTAEGELVAGELQKRFFAGWLALMRLPEFLHRDSMRGVVWQLVDRPSLVSIIAERGVSMSLKMNTAEVEEVPPAYWGVGTTYRVPLEVEINGTRAMECSLLLARPAPPLGPCSGMLGFDAVNPRNPAKRVTVRLLAARRREVEAKAMPFDLRSPEELRLEQRGSN